MQGGLSEVVQTSRGHWRQSRRAENDDVTTQAVSRPTAILLGRVEEVVRKVDVKDVSDVGIVETNTQGSRCGQDGLFAVTEVGDHGIGCLSMERVHVQHRGNLLRLRFGPAKHQRTVFGAVIGTTTLVRFEEFGKDLFLVLADSDSIRNLGPVGRHAYDPPDVLCRFREGWDQLRR